MFGDWRPHAQVRSSTDTSAGSPVYNGKPYHLSTLANSMRNPKWSPQDSSLPKCFCPMIEGRENVTAVIARAVAGHYYMTCGFGKGPDYTDSCPFYGMLNPCLDGLNSPLRFYQSGCCVKTRSTPRQDLDVSRPVSSLYILKLILVY